MEAKTPELDLEKLEKDIRDIVKENELLIKEINNFKNSNEYFLKKTYKVFPKPFSADSTPNDPYFFECEPIIQKLAKSQVVNDWRVPSDHEKPQEVDPDKLLYGESKDLMVMTCENVEDLIRINNQMTVCARIVQNLLKLLLDALKPENTSDDSLHQILKGRVDELNSQMALIFKNKVVFNDWTGININSEILTNEMKLSLAKMIPNWNNFQFTLAGKFNEQNNRIKGNRSETQFFNDLVAGLGPVLIIVHSTTNYVFGAYVDQTFNQNNQGGMFGCQSVPFGNNIQNPANLFGEKNEETFLFSFGQFENFSPIKLLPKMGEKFPKPNCNCGLHMDTDLVLFCQYSCSPRLFTRVAPGFQNKQVTSETLAGSVNFRSTLIEVFTTNK